MTEGSDVRFVHGGPSAQDDMPDGDGAVSSIALGDLDGDGKTDLVWGVPNASPGGWDGAGEVLIFFDVLGRLP